MKKVFALALAFLLGISFPFGQVKNGAVAVSTREELMRIADNPNGDYVLTADIDLGDEPWTPIPFSGTFDGAGHTIGNLTVQAPGADACVTFDGNRIKHDTVCAGLFSVVTDAEIRNVRILNAKIEIETDANCFLGAIAGYAKESTFENCTVSMRGRLTLRGESCGVGGMVGFFENSLADTCTVEAELLFIDVNQDYLCEEFLGGIYAAGYGNIKDSKVFTRGYADIYGYAHNGGVVGMFKLPHGYKGKMPSIRDTDVDAEIRFFEVTPSRRAYCEAIIGENCAEDCYLTHNHVQHFDFTYSKTATPFRPETCESPSYTENVTEPTCTEWGYTTYTCPQCGYSYRDDYIYPCHKYRGETTEATCTEAGHTTYTCEFCGDAYTETIPAAGHTPGEWTVTKQAGPDEEGEETLFCAVCGEALDTRAIPPTGNVQEPAVSAETVTVLVIGVTLAETVIELHTGETADLHASVEPESASDTSLRFESSDPSVVRVDSEGHLTALYPGTATIRVYSRDGGAETTCSVLVTAVQEEEAHSLFSWMRCG